jgi:hypothetical protein
MSFALWLAFGKILQKILKEAFGSRGSTVRTVVRLAGDRLAVLAFVV